MAQQNVSIDGGLILYGSVAGSVTFAGQAYAGNSTLVFPNVLPTQNQTLTAVNVVGSTVTLGWTAPVVEAVTSVFGRTGAVVAQSGDYSYSQISGTPASPLPINQGGTGTTSPSLVAGTNVTVSGTWPNQTINASGGGAVSSVFGRTGAVVAQSGDYSSFYQAFVTSGGWVTSNNIAQTAGDALYFNGSLSDNNWGIGVDNNSHPFPNTGWFSVSHVGPNSVLKIVHGGGSTDGFAIGQSTQQSDLEIDHNNKVWITHALDVAGTFTTEGFTSFSPSSTGVALSITGDAANSNIINIYPHGSGTPYGTFFKDGLGGIGVSFTQPSNSAQGSYAAGQTIITSSDGTKSINLNPGTSGGTTFTGSAGWGIASFTGEVDFHGLTGNALRVLSGASVFSGTVSLNSSVNDHSGLSGTPGQILTSTGSQILWAQNPAALYLETLSASAPISFLNQDLVLLVNTTSGGFNITLPNPSTSGNYTITVKKISSDGNTATILPFSGETIEFTSSASVSVRGQTVTLLTDTTNWYIVSSMAS